LSKKNVAPSTLSASGEEKSASTPGSPPAVKWWQWECERCDLKFCSTMLYQEHLGECHRAVLEDPYAHSHSNAGSRSISAYPSVTCSPSIAFKSLHNSAANSSNPLRVEDYASDDVALAEYLSSCGGAEIATKGVHNISSSGQLNILKDSPFSSIPSIARDIDATCQGARKPVGSSNTLEFTTLSVHGRSQEGIKR
jgi:hypothetical protein